MCTGIRFSDKSGHMYFGRNLDWSSSFGQKIVVTPRKYNYHYAFLGEGHPKFAVIGMGIVQENAPLYFDCGNEAGLAVAGLNFPGFAQYEPSPISGKTNLAAFEFPLWVAMNFATVREVEDALQSVAIVAQPINEKYPVSYLHWLIGDKDRSIVVEYTSGGLEIFQNDVDVLTNVPGFKEQRAKITDSVPGDYSSTSRFIKAVFLNSHYPLKSSEEENVLRLFHTLGGVAEPEGAQNLPDGSLEKTIYTDCYSTTTNTYYWNTYEDFGLKSAALSNFDLESSRLLEKTQ